MGAARVLAAAAVAAIVATDTSNPATVNLTANWASPQGHRSKLGRQGTMSITVVDDNEIDVGYQQSNGPAATNVVLDRIRG